jgi:fluoroquinolone resistance protein
MSDPVAPDVEDESISGEDWYAEELLDRTYRRCSFFDVDLTEATSRGSLFEECTFGNVKFNASRHDDSAYIRCTFDRCNFFEAEFTGCKLLGSSFKDCQLRPLTIHNGDWSFVGMSGANLRGVNLRGVRMREADLSGANLTEATVSDVDLSGAHLRSVNLTRCDLRGTDLTALDPARATLTGAMITAEQAIIIAALLGLRVG